MLFHQQALRAWPLHEFQLSQIRNENGKESLGVRIVTTHLVAQLIQKLLTREAIPCSLVEEQDEKQDLSYVYLDRLYYVKAAALVKSNIQPVIHPLPGDLKTVMDLASAHPDPARLAGVSAPTPATEPQASSTPSPSGQLPGPQAPSSPFAGPAPPNIPAELWNRLTEYQREGVQRFIDFSGRLLLADDPGLGKTLQAIVCAAVYKEKWPILVVCPSSVKENWRKEFCRWLDVKDPSVRITREDVCLIERTREAVTLLPAPESGGSATNSLKRKRPMSNGASAASKRTKREAALQSAPEIDPLKAARASALRKKALERKEKALKESASKPVRQFKVYIISYDLMIRPVVYARLLQKRFQVIAVDESHFIRNPTSQRSGGLVGLAMKASHVIELSGTPAFVPSQMFTQIQALQPKLLQPYWISPPPYVVTQEKFREHAHRLPFSFGSRWCDPCPEPTFAGKFTWSLKGTSRLNELNAVLREFCLIKRVKDEVLKELPEKVRHPITFQVATEDRQVIETEMTAIKGLRQTKPLEFKRRFMAMWNDLPRVKGPGVREYLKMIFEKGDMAVDKTRKCIIFAHHRAMISLIKEVVEEVGEGYILITGDTLTRTRQDRVDQFQNNPKIRVAILSLTAAGFGLNMQAASLVIFAELFFGSDSLIQAEDRAHRLGQTAKVVTCRYLIAQGTLDEGLIRMVNRKNNSSCQMIEGKEGVFAMKRAERLRLSTDREEEAVPTEEQLEEEAFSEVLDAPEELYSSTSSQA